MFSLISWNVLIPVVTVKCRFDRGRFEIALWELGEKGFLFVKERNKGIMCDPVDPGRVRKSMALYGAAMKEESQH